MRFNRVQTQPGQDPLMAARFRLHRTDDWQEYTVPAAWSSAAVEVLVNSLFCPLPLPALTRPVPEEGVPEWLWRREPDLAALEGVSAEWRFRHERDARELFNRIAGGLCHAAWKAGIFDAEEDARTFYDEFRLLLLRQKAAPEIALLSAAGLNWAYGVEQPLFVPQARIAPFSDDLPAAGLDGAGIAIAAGTRQKNLLRRIKILAERLALEGEDRRMQVTLPVENIDSPGFAALKRRADLDALARDIGARMFEAAMNRVMDACDRESVLGFDADFNPELGRAFDEARRAGIPDAALQAALSYAQQGHESASLPRMPADEAQLPAVAAVLSLPDEFIERALTGHGFMLQEAGEDKRHYPAEKLWEEVIEALWASGEPSLFFRDSAPGFAGRDAALSGRGGVLFLPGTETPSATVNLAAFMGDGDHLVDAAALDAAVAVMAVALEAGYAFMARSDKTLEYRPISIGFTGLAALLMGNAIPYDSDAGRNTAALVAALVGGAAHRASADIASKTGAFPNYPAAEKHCLQAIRDKMSAVSGTAYMQKGVTRRPVQLNIRQCADARLARAVAAAWEEAYARGREHGFRHAHLTAAGTDFALQNLLGAQTHDIAPETGATRFEGYFSDTLETAELYGKKLNPMVPRALKRLGYGPAQLDDIYFYAIGHGTLLDAPCINHATLKARGFHQAALDALEAALKSAQHIRYAFNKWTLGEEFCRRMLGFSAGQLASGAFDMLRALGFSEDEIDAANLYCCGTMTLEGAPHLKVQHLSVFDCRAPAPAGVRSVSPEAQIRMQAALEPFLSGAVVHTVELPHHTTIDEVDRLALLGWELGVRQLRLYRDSCSLLHPVIAPAAAPVAEEERGEMVPQRLRAAS